MRRFSRLLEYGFTSNREGCVNLLGVLMRYYSYAYHGLLGLILLGLATVALASGLHTLQLEMLPWTGAALTWWLLGGSLFGLVSVVLAFKGITRVLFLVWSLVVALLLLKGLFFSTYRFTPGETAMPLLVAAGALLAVIGALFQFIASPGHKDKSYSAGR